MIAGPNRLRRQLNARARALLKAVVEWLIRHLQRG